MVECGADHLKALCVVAGHLAERFWVVMHRGMPYVLCDTDGDPVTRAEAMTIIAERWTVPAGVRARRRSKKAGKAPQQALAGQVRSDARGADKRGDLPRPPSSKSRGRDVKHSPALTADPR